MKEKVIPLPERIRKISKSYGWIDHRILREGWVKKMTIQEFAVYTFLVLAADSDGVSYYRKEKIAHILDLDFIVLGNSIERLIKQGLIVFLPFSTHDPNGFYQVLDVPGVSLGHICTATVSGEDSGPQRVSEIFKNILGEGERYGCGSVGRDSQAQEDRGTFKPGNCTKA
jgi:hypothetical protein